MSDLDIPIMVVNNAEFSSATITKVLRSRGFTNVQFTNNPQEALRSLEKRPVQLVLADWRMPTMDGLELTKHIRRLDADHDHFTYTMLMMSQDEIEPLEEALDRGVNDFLNRANIRTQLLPRVLAATRTAKRENELLKSNSLLKKKVKDLQTTDLIDPVTGLGNLHFTLERVQATLKQSEARGGTACMLLIGINNLEEMKSQFEQSSIDEVMSGMNAKIRGLVRPLDIVTRPQANLFAVITLQESMKNCTSQSFKRVFDSLYMHSFRTNEGYIPVVIGVSITGANSSTGHPSAKDFMRFSQDGLNLSYQTGSITARSFDSHSNINV